MQTPIKIVCIGPESSGKTTLSQDLARHFHTVWAPEYARQYVENLQRPYTFNDVVHIAWQQPQWEANHAAKANHLLLLDTDLLITQGWFDVVYKKRPEGFDSLIEQYHGDFYLLCQPDIKWEYDPVREYSDLRMRQYLFAYYQQQLEQRGWPYRMISGLGSVRFQNSLQAIETFLQARSVSS